MDRSSDIWGAEHGARECLCMRTWIGGSQFVAILGLGSVLGCVGRVGVILP
jgi:hypothetical protein